MTPRQPGALEGSASSPPSILIVNAYSARNLGDGAIVETMCRAFGSRGARVTVMSDDPRDGDRYGVPVLRSLLPVWSPPLRGLPGAASEAARATLQSIRRPPPLLDEFDLIVSAGGGYLYDDGSARSRRNLLRRLHTVRVAHRTGLPVVAFSQSVGPFASPTLGRLTGRVLARCDAVFVREELSLRECAEIGVPRAELADDIVFTATGARRDPTVEALLSRFGGRAPIGVTVIDWRFGDAAGWEQARARYLGALQRSLAEAARRFDRPVAVLSQVDAHAGDSDRVLGERLADALAGECEAQFVDVTGLSLPQIVAFYGRLHVLVASRMHSGIFALAGGTPVVAVSYLPKTDGIMERAGLGRFVVPIADVEAAQLFELLRLVESGREELSSALSVRVEELRGNALSAVEMTLSLAQTRWSGVNRHRHAG